MLRRLKAILDKSILTFCGFAIVTLVITVTWQVFSRYVLNDPSSFTDELARYTMIWFGLSGASYLFGKNGHLAITLFIGSVNHKYRKHFHALINLISIVFISLAMIKGGVLLMGRTMMQYSPALQIPMAYVYLVLPLTGLLMVIYLTLSTIDVYKPVQSAREEQ
ncbi:TRAP transporter small permease subunit [Vibrio sp. MACH09]|uniref:TRAP transporter small permease n=1 Tax=unclassified Vibrio TaxID=2614977 RepID=UPI001493D324|nr:TRAP transporter small permease subunit [Vibrio sp. MACH09]